MELQKVLNSYSLGLYEGCLHLEREKRNDGGFEPKTHYLNIYIYI